MFTGIIECMGTVERVSKEADNVHFTIASPISAELKIDQSLAHNGVCLTVVALGEGTHTVTAIRETLNKTNLGDWSTGSMMNLERCMKADGRFDGHIVQGHVDCTAVCTAVAEEGGSWRYSFEYTGDYVTVEKGSVTVNGTSLTVVDSRDKGFSVAIIPYTYSNTVFHALKPGDTVNLEFDIVGKYISRLMGLA